MRKLCIIAAGYTAAVLFSKYLLPQNLILLSGTVFAALFFIVLLINRRCRANKNITAVSNLKLKILLITASAAAGFIWFFMYTAVFVNPVLEYAGSTIKTEAVVKDYPVARASGGYRADVVIHKDNGMSFDVRLYYYDEIALQPGDEIEFTAAFFRTDTDRDGERYDGLTSQGIFLSASVKEKIRIAGTGNSFIFFPKRFAGMIAGKIDEIYSEDTRPFLKALLIGRREELNNDKAVTAALTASGIIHVVAVSGMHISFLMGFLALIIRNKRLFAIYGIPVLLVFMAMNGFSPAVTRAGIMQIFLICAPLFKRDSDSMTSLSAAMLLLLIINPYACASVGLQMSFAATAGISGFASRINNTAVEFMRDRVIYKKKTVKYITGYIIANAATTIGALIFTLPLSILHFGYISLISPVTNLLVIGVVSLTFPAGLFTVALGSIHPAAGMIMAVPVDTAVRYILFIARNLGSVPYSVAYSSNIYVMLWLAYVYLMFTVLPLFKARARQYLYPVCIAVILLFSVILISVIFPSVTENFITVLDVGQGLSVVAGLDGYSMVIDCGSISTNKAGEITHEYLQSTGHTSIDLLVITHFHDDHINGIEFLLGRNSVAALAIPDPEGSFAAEDIINLARRKGTDIIYVTEEINLIHGDNRIFLYPPLGSGDENERGISVLIDGGMTALITGDMNAKVERALLRYTDLPKLDILVVGHHGSRESTCEELLSALTPEIAIIPVGRNNFGHPHKDVLTRLIQADSVIYRTDETGHITVTAGAFR